MCVDVIVESCVAMFLLCSELEELLDQLIICESYDDSYDK